MKFEPKPYQNLVLADLADFFRQARMTGDFAAAYKAVANRRGDNRYAGIYHDFPGLDNVPHVCVRVPTAGGKTFTAAHSLQIAAEYAENENPTVLWFAPTDAIVKQTLLALKNTDHPCREALHESFGRNADSFEIIGVEDFENLTPQDFTGKICVIVSTAAMFRVKDTERETDDASAEFDEEKMQKATRRIYASKECFYPHFEQFLPDEPPETLERHAKGRFKGEIKYSFANLLHLARPLVVLDEAQNFVSDLSKRVIRRLNPACILEWTATPRELKTGKPLHNVITSVSAETLQAEEMVKLPIVVAEHSGWKETVAGAVREREGLAAAAKESGETLRPVVLYQAHNKNGEVPPKKLKHHLMESENIPEEKIAVATGEIKELEGVDLMARGCPIEHIITIDALREGWDCPFAYVLCSVANVQSTVAIEQLLGRVMRMPHAQKRKREELNRAYAHVPKNTGQISAAAAELGDKLASKLGFEEEEVDAAVQAKLDDAWDDELGIFAPAAPQVFTLQTAPDFSMCEPAEQDELQKTVKITPAESGGVKLQLTRPISGAARDAIVAAAPKDKQPEVKEGLRREIIVLARKESPAARGEKFAPLPLFWFHSPENGELELTGDNLHLVADWNNLGENCLLSDFDDKDTAEFYKIFLETGKVRVSGMDKPESLPLWRADAENWTEARLAAWLERQIYYKDGRIWSPTLKTLAVENINHLLAKGKSMADLARAKYALAEALRRWLAAHCEKVSEQTLQKHVLDNKDLRADFSFNFPPSCKTGGKLYEGRWKFRKHYYERAGAMNADEVACARILDGAKEVRFWVRNLSNNPDAYKLPRGGGRNFYPDFVVQLEDGRTLAVEYKGGFIADAKDAATKAAVGAYLEKTSKGRWFFLMPSISDGAPPLKTQIESKFRKIAETVAG